MPTSSTPTPTPTRSRHKVENYIDPDKAMTDSAFTDLNYRDEIIRQSSLVAYYTAQSAKAVRQVGNLKLLLDVKESQVSTKVRADALTAGEKITVDVVANKVSVDKEVLALKMALLSAQEVDNVLRGIVTALRDKSTMLVTHNTIVRDDLRATRAVDGETQYTPDHDRALRADHLKNRLASL